RSRSILPTPRSPVTLEDDFGMKLTSMDVRRLREPGKYGDGHGLILHVVMRDRRNWLFRYVLRGRERNMGLGSAENGARGSARRSPSSTQTAHPRDRSEIGRASGRERDESQ